MKEQDNKTAEEQPNEVEIGRTVKVMAYVL